MSSTPRVGDESPLEAWLEQMKLNSKDVPYPYYTANKEAIAVIEKLKDGLEFLSEGGKCSECAQNMYADAVAKKYLEIDPEKL